jgi:hypothetical protein
MVLLAAPIQLMALSSYLNAFLVVDHFKKLVVPQLAMNHRFPSRARYWLSS